VSLKTVKFTTSRAFELGDHVLKEFNKWFRPGSAAAKGLEPSTCWADSRDIPLRDFTCIK
jgi:hypothetical protein